MKLKNNKIGVNNDIKSKKLKGDIVKIETSPLVQFIKIGLITTSLSVVSLNMDVNVDVDVNIGGNNIIVSNIVVNEETLNESTALHTSVDTSKLMLKGTLEGVIGTTTNPLI